MSLQRSMIKVKASDGFETDTYSVKPEAKTGAGLICVMEAFGLNEHIKRVADDYAAAGFSILAPSLYDRIGRQQTFDYDTQLPKAIEIMKQNGFDNPLADIRGCINYFKDQGINKIGVFGYCYGGTISWLAASRITGIDSACCFYGSAIAAFPEDHPQCATIAHWGRADPTTPEDKIAPVAASNPDVTMYWYDAGHGFNSVERAASFDADAARLARERTLQLFTRQLL